ncbi:hypothetical protein LSCM1_04501 [Leishmania martiniquensis]|uniref:Leucine-rich repeat protein n=1 Tax=Leishmania martiniquensis TaxID=1580590 RepID=A0A836GF56_9TRYP|nr:hypothetical protein LSCM1_04501 [Leishmania martiniquensis]
MEIRTAAARKVRGAATRSYYRNDCIGALSFATALALACALCYQANALEVGKFLPGNASMSAKARYDSVKAVQALKRAIDDPELQLKVTAALTNVKNGFDICQSALYRCNSATGVIEEAVISGMRGGTIKWNEFPESVKRIRITGSRLSQPLVLSSLPENLQEFMATNVEWQSNSILQRWPSGESLPGDGPAPQLRVFQCDECALVRADVTLSAPQVAALRVLSLSGNPNLLVDLRNLPRTLESLTVSKTKLVQSTVKEALEAAPVSLSLLNISFTDITFALEMLSSASAQLEALDVSGLRSGSPGSLLPAVPLPLACSESGFNPRELYFRTCGLIGFLPDLRRCTKLRVLDLSHNFLSGAALAQLPEAMKQLSLSHNTIRSSLHTDALPRSLLHLDLSGNEFTGSFNLSGLPQQLQYLDISHNRFNGTLNLTRLPESVKFVYIQYNSFSGAVDLVDIPLGIRFIMVHHNDWDYHLPAL